MTAKVQRLMQDPEIDSSLKPCPFCGAPAQIEFWHGGKPSKRMISCSNDACFVNPGVTGENKADAVAAWQRRAP